LIGDELIGLFNAVVQTNTRHAALDPVVPVGADAARVVRNLPLPVVDRRTKHRADVAVVADTFLVRVPGAVEKHRDVFRHTHSFVIEVARLSTHQ
jgi:hypothetical protein